MVKQIECDEIVDRIRQAVEKFGGTSDELKECRRIYEMFHRSPDPVSWILLDEELKKLGF